MITTYCRSPKLRSLKSKKERRTDHSCGDTGLSWGNTLLQAIRVGRAVFAPDVQGLLSVPELCRTPDYSGRSLSEICI